MRTLRTNTTHGAVSRDTRSLLFSLRPNHPHQNKTSEGQARKEAKRANISIRMIGSCRESHVHRAFVKTISVQYRNQDLPLGPSDMFFAV
jgi:hypothetical protein